MNTDIKILIGVVALVVIAIVVFLIFKSRENFNCCKNVNPAETFYQYIKYLYSSIHKTLLPNFYNSTRTTDITKCSDISWPPAIQNHTTINHLNKVYDQFKSKYAERIEKVKKMYLINYNDKDTAAYTSEYNKLVNILDNMSIPDPLSINITRLNASIVLNGSPNILKHLIKTYGSDFSSMQDFVQHNTPF
jgi:hypothetical protein